MDYVPPERPAIIAEANKRLVAESHRSWGKLIDTGMIDQMPYPSNWLDTTTWFQRVNLKALKPGQRVALLKPNTGSGPLIYIEQHKPCSQKAFESFAHIVKENKPGDLSGTQLTSLSEILGDRATDKSYCTQAAVMDLGGRKGIDVFSGRPSEHRMGRAFFLVSDPKHRLIQEVGYEGAKGGGDEWRNDAEEMLNNIQFVKSKSE